MKSKFTLIYSGLLALSIAFLSVSGGPTGNLTGAVGDNDSGCSGCHGGSYHATEVALVGAPASIAPSQTYDFKFRISSASNPTAFKGGGFQLLATYLGQNSMVGNFTAVDPGTKVSNPGNQRLVHNAARAKTGNAVEWDVRWTAPATLTDPVTFYYAGNAVNLDGGNGSGDVVKLGSTAIALPVTFAGFSAKANPEGTELNWQTATESNNDYFSVERSTDGRIFFAIGEVSGYGDSDVERDYQFVDKTPVAGRTNYYRLRQVDFDGAESFSPVVNVTVGETIASWTFGPNPAAPGQTVRFSGELPANLQLLNSRGQSVQQIATTDSEWTLDAQLPAGVYYLYAPQTGSGQRLLVQ